MAAFTSPATSRTLNDSQSLSFSTAIISSKPDSVYHPRSSYRSVAFGTWKVGEASRRFSHKYSVPAMPSEIPAELKITRSFEPEKCKNKDSTLNANQQINSTIQIETRPSTTLRAPKSVRLSKSIRESLSISLQELVQSAPSEMFEMSPNPVERPFRRQGSECSDKWTKLGKRGGDCYSSTEYVQYCAQNTYENVIVDSRLCRKPSFNRSMDALNDRLIQCSVPRNAPGTGSKSGISTSRTNKSPTRYNVNSLPRRPNVYNPEKVSSPTQTTPPLTEARSGSKPAVFVIDPCCSFAETSTMDRSFAKSRKVQPTEDMRQRTKSLDNATRFAVCPKFGNQSVMDCSAKPPLPTSNPRGPIPGSSNAGTLQSAKKFLRKLYNTSTLKFRSNPEKSGQRKESGNQKYQLATSPFFEMRLPEPEERPFLPYNIHYQIESEENAPAPLMTTSLYNPPTSKNLSLSQLQMSTSKCWEPATSFANSPDEGIYCPSISSSNSSSTTKQRNRQMTNHAGAILDESISAKGQHCDSSGLAPVVPPNFEDFFDLSSTSSSPEQVHRSLNETQQNSPLQSSLGYMSGGSHVGEGDTFPTDANSSFATTSLFEAQNVNSLEPNFSTMDLNDGTEEKRFPNWTELFQYLKKEITEIRASDAQIFSNLKTIEKEISCVKRDNERHNSCSPNGFVS
ncbi:hypothetical protein DdX_09634 [Ditylenchus destructor]|uniref:Uncharacterized protein n=1 Tax=Ditylenchus destructor TaxID=166010 RepID=A0AAD4N0U1_9BILA|nr:hypothetical protein DdX_09634 [Ditylenchus destructor]